MPDKHQLFSRSPITCFSCLKKTRLVQDSSSTGHFYDLLARKPQPVNRQVLIPFVPIVAICPVMVVDDGKGYDSVGLTRADPFMDPSVEPDPVGDEAGFPVRVPGGHVLSPVEVYPADPVVGRSLRFQAV